MALDYSKWDKLELSDDSDIEGHPNVDKASLIRWKQQDIRQKRQQRSFRENQLRVNIETNTELLARIDALVAAKADLKDIPAAVKTAAAGRPHKKPTLATSPEQPCYDDMIESLLEQVAGNEGALQVNRKMIEGALVDEKKELAGIEFEKKQHITADDMRDGWNSTFLNKTPSGPAAPEPKAGTSSTASTASTASAPSSASTPSTPSSASAPRASKNDDGLEELLPDTAKFGEIPASNLEMAGSFLISHPHIISENQKDALIMTAFDAQLAGETKRAENIVHQALLIQYSAILGGVNGARKFISRIADKKHPAAVGFHEEVASTCKHIKNRCEVLQTENEPEPVEQIQLHAVDPNTEILVQVPEPDSENYEIYDAFGQHIKDAIASRSLDEINKVLADMPLEEAEQLVAQLSESGVLMVEEKIYDAAEWQERKHELEEQDVDHDADQAHDAPSPSANPPASTIDELD